MSSIQKLLRKVQSDEGMPTPWTGFELYRYLVSHTSNRVALSGALTLGIDDESIVCSHFYGSGPCASLV